VSTEIEKLFFLDPRAEWSPGGCHFSICVCARVSHIVPLYIFHFVFVSLALFALHAVCQKRERERAAAGIFRQCAQAFLICGGARSGCADTRARECGIVFQTKTLKIVFPCCFSFCFTFTQANFCSTRKSLAVTPIKKVIKVLDNVKFI
jgi:hypothetical protein